jgi:hypothetical protein
VFENYPDMPGERSKNGAVTAGGAKAAWFKDSEGNTMAIIQEAYAARHVAGRHTAAGSVEQHSANSGRSA